MASSVRSSSESNSVTASSPTTVNLQVQQLDKRLWRAIDFLHLLVMVFSLYTAIIVAILRHELFEQCPLYAKLYLRNNVTQFSTDTIDRQTVWGSVYTCEFASFAYLSAFALSFISLWIHIVFRRVLRTERLLRLPIGVLTLLFALLTLTATIVVTDGVIKFCSGSQPIICSSAGGEIFSQSRWKVFSLPAGGWLSSLSILLNTLARVVQLFAKPKKSPETLKILLNQLMLQRHQHKAEKVSSEYGSEVSQSSKDRTRPRTSTRRYSADHVHHRDFAPEPYPYSHPSVPQYRRIEKRSRFQRLCCPCFRRRRRGLRSVQEPYRPYIVPEEYFHRLDPLKQNGTVSSNLCHRHSMHYPVEDHTQTDTSRQHKSIDQASTETPFLGRRRSSVRFEDEIPTPPSAKEVSLPVQVEAIPTVERKDEQIASPASDNDLQRNVSFRNNEDDLWTTITINTKQSAPIQSSHFNRLTVENLSQINTSVSNSDNGVTAIQINSVPNASLSTETCPKEIPLPPPLLLPQPSSHAMRSRLKPLPPPPSQTLVKSVRSRHKPPSSRELTTSSEDDTDLRNIKPVEEINTLVANKYNYNDVSQALKSNVERLKSTFIQAQESQSHYDKPTSFRPTLFHKSSAHASATPHSSDC